MRTRLTKHVLTQRRRSALWLTSSHSVATCSDFDLFRSVRVPFTPGKQNGDSEGENEKKQLVGASAEQAARSTSAQQRRRSHCACSRQQQREKTTAPRDKNHNTLRGTPRPLSSSSARRPLKRSSWTPPPSTVLFSTLFFNGFPFRTRLDTLSIKKFEKIDCSMEQDGYWLSPSFGKIETPTKTTFQYSHYKKKEP